MVISVRVPKQFLVRLSVNVTFSLKEGKKVLNLFTNSLPLSVIFCLGGFLMV